MGWAARVELTQATKDEFDGRAFGFGRADCMMLAYAHLARFGYDLPEFPAYRGLQGAQAALAETGADNLRDLLDRYLEPIPPAFLWPGDLVALQARRFDALAISTGALLYGWSEGHVGPVNFGVTEKGLLRAWRVIDRREVAA